MGRRWDGGEHGMEKRWLEEERWAMEGDYEDEGMTHLDRPRETGAGDPGLIADREREEAKLNYESHGGRYSSPGPKITATRPLPGKDLDNSGVPKPKPITPVHRRVDGWADRS